MGRRNLTLPARLSGGILLLMLGLVSLSRAQAATGDAFLPEFDLRFDLRRDGLLVGHTVVRLRKRADECWEYTRRSRPAGVASLLRSDIVEETSRWRPHQGRIRPEKYDYHRRGDHPRRVRIDFDWAKNQAANTLDEQTWRMPLPHGALDKLSVELALMRDLRSSGSGEQRTWRYSMADGGRLKHYLFEMQGRETLESPVGPLQTRVLLSRRNHDDQRTRYWMASELGYLPVRIERLREDDETAVMQLTELNVKGAPGIP